MVNHPQARVRNNIRCDVPVLRVEREPAPACREHESKRVAALLELFHDLERLRDVLIGRNAVVLGRERRDDLAVFRRLSKVSRSMKSCVWSIVVRPSHPSGRAAWHRCSDCRRWRFSCRYPGSDRKPSSAEFRIGWRSGFRRAMPSAETPITAVAPAAVNLSMFLREGGGLQDQQPLV